MSVVIRNVPKGHNWGWFSREDPRMHLQTVDQKHDYKIWLEENGRRIFEPVGKIPSTVLKKIAEEVAAHRKFVETNWVRFMIKQNWLQLHVSLPEFVLIAYPNYPHKFTRKLDLTNEINPDFLKSLRPEAFELNREMGSVRLDKNVPEAGAFDIRISSLLWQD